MAVLLRRSVAILLRRREARLLRRRVAILQLGRRVGVVLLRLRVRVLRLRVWRVSIRLLLFVLLERLPAGELLARRTIALLARFSSSERVAEQRHPTCSCIHTYRVGACRPRARRGIGRPLALSLRREADRRRRGHVWFRREGVRLVHRQAAALGPSRSP